MSYNLNDNIVALSSGLDGYKKIVRVSGPQAFDIIVAITENIDTNKKVSKAKIKLNGRFSIESEVLIFHSPNSYTGDNLVELHFIANKPAIEKMIESIISNNARPAEPGEFTARAYLNGKIGLAQAEAVAKIVSAGSDTKLDAARKLLDGKLSKTVGKIRENIMDLMSLIEAGMDFSDEDIEFISSKDAAIRIRQIQASLDELLNKTIHYESVIDLPSVLIAGVPNAGKSSLTNAILGFERSIVSDIHATTRDVLSGELELQNNSCMIFDCAGLIENPEMLLDKLAQQATIEAIKDARLILFCLDGSKENYKDDAAALSLIKQYFKKEIIAVITKSDLLDKQNLNEKAGLLNNITTRDIVITSTKTNKGIGKLCLLLDEIIGEITTAHHNSDSVAINQRHINSVKTACSQCVEATDEIRNQNYETAAMFLRTAYQTLGQIENEQIDEQMLDRIFANFCIGK